MKSYNLFLATLIPLLTSCVTQQASTIDGASYDERKDHTEYFVLPYGTVIIPGKWEKTHYNSVSWQQFFSNTDSIKIAIAFGAYDKYPFNTDGSKKEFEFVKSFYEWDSKYFVDNHGLNREIVEEDSINNFIIWRLYGSKDDGNFDSYFLFGEKNGSVSNYSVMATDKWQKQSKIMFLRNLYLVKKEE